MHGEVRDMLRVGGAEPGDPTLPVIVFFYGGGWDSGSRTLYGWAAQALAARETFAHALSLSIDFHQTKRTGSLSRVIDRGARSMDFLLRSFEWSFDRVTAGYAWALKRPDATILYILALPFSFAVPDAAPSAGVFVRDLVLYFLIGDPNADKTRNQVTLKLIRPI